MILQKGFADEYLENYKNDKIQMGLGIGLPTPDYHLSYKQGEFTIINGLDNVGKTVWILWYFLCLSVKHNLTWVIWSGENKSEQLVRQLIQFRSGKRLKDLELKDIYRYRAEIDQWFSFVDNKNLYKSSDLLKIFKQSGCSGALIDPYTGLDREFTHAANYDFLNETRHFVNSEGISVFVNTHPNTEASRRIYPLEHDLAGYQMPPIRSQSEGGQPFANRPDNFLTIHRLVGHPEYQYQTFVYVRKVKDTETGGTPNGNDDPLVFEFNSGLGFTSNGQNPLTNTIKDSQTFDNLEINHNFDEAPF